MIQTLAQVQIAIVGFSRYQEYDDPHFTNYSSVYLKRDTQNEYDANAIGAYRDKYCKIFSGYARRDFAEVLAKIMDDIEFSEIKFEGIFTFVCESFAYVTVDILGTSKSKLKIRKILKDGQFNMMSDEESFDLFQKLQGNVITHLPDEEIDILFLPKTTTIHIKENICNQKISKDSLYLNQP